MLRAEIFQHAKDNLNEMSFAQIDELLTETLRIRHKMVLAEPMEIKPRTMPEVEESFGYDGRD